MWHFEKKLLNSTGRTRVCYHRRKGSSDSDVMEVRMTGNKFHNSIVQKKIVVLLLGVFLFLACTKAKKESEIDMNRRSFLGAGLATLALCAIGAQRNADSNPSTDSASGPFKTAEANCVHASADRRFFERGAWT
jgi:hypothetical protein